MIEADLSPRDPVRWWLSVAVEREMSDRERDDGDGPNIQVVE